MSINDVSYTKINVILTKLSELESLEGEYTKMLRSLRGNDFEKDIEEDTRASVKNVYTLLQEVRVDIDLIKCIPVPLERGTRTSSLFN